MRESFERLDSLIQQGRGAQVRKELNQLASRKIRREHLLDVARFARRVHLSRLAIKLLNPLVRPTGKASDKATVEERAEYAANLTFLGATEEALQILEECDVKEVPQVGLFRAYALFAQWDYAASIPLLSEYVKTPQLTDYRRLVGNVNLAAALVHERKHAEADSLLSRLLDEAESQRLVLLQGNLLELAAQSAVTRGDWPRAEHFLDRAGRLLEKASAVDRFVVTKWKSILAFRRAPKSAAALAELRAMRETARELDNWESLRDGERYEALGIGDRELLRKVFYGTPFASFRKQLLVDYGAPLSLSSDYVWRLQKGKRAGVLDLNVERGEKLTTPLELGGLLHRLLVTLSRDFYRPARVASIHFQLYPDEYFNPISSPQRVHQIVKRLRAWLGENRLPLEVRERSGYYSLHSTTPFGIRILSDETLLHRDDVRLRALRRIGDKGPFSAREAGKLLGLSPRSALRLLEAKEKEGVIRRQGSGPQIRYSFKR
jgi:hypothetical protein